MKFVFTLLIIALHLYDTFGQNEFNRRLLYSCDFEEAGDLDDWVMEGPGIAKIEEGKLMLHSKYFGAVEEYYKENGGSFSSSGGVFYVAVEKAIRKDIGDSIQQYYSNGRFMGGHLVFWNKFKTPENYIIECDFQSLSNNALHMLMFSATGDKGQSVFAPELRRRNGLGGQYTQGDLYNYRISFFAPGRNTSNMRKCPGRVLTVQGPDFTLDNKMKPHHLKIIKYNNLVRWYIDDKLSFKFEDDLNSFLKGGQTAIRVMVPAKGVYDNYMIYEIVE